MRRAVRVLVVLVAVGGILLLFVLPARTWLAQGRATAAASRRVAALTAENAALTTRTRQLESKPYIEQIARQEYGLVMPGEKSFAILPPTAPATTTTVATAAPRPAAASRSHPSFWSNLEFWK